MPEAAGVEVADGLLACAWLSVGVPPDAKKNFVFRVLSRLVIALTGFVHSAPYARRCWNRAGSLKCFGTIIVLLLFTDLSSADGLVDGQLKTVKRASYSDGPA